MRSRAPNNSSRNIDGSTDDCRRCSPNMPSSTRRKPRANRSWICFGTKSPRSSRRNSSPAKKKKSKIATNSPATAKGSLSSPTESQTDFPRQRIPSLSQLAETQRLLRELEKIDSSIAQFSSAHAAAVVELSEIARTLSAYAENFDLDPEQLAAVEQRVSLFETLKRKYGASIADVIAFGERATERMRKIEGRDAELERLTKDIEDVRAEMNRAGEALRKARRKVAPKLSENIRRNLRDLGFRQSEFEAKLTPLDAPRPNGFDSVELLFSPNPGEPLKPLRTIASSGEISRLMLAIKSALAAHDAIPLLVFDEIDTNVGGEIAHAVGAKMQTLGRDHQVICITHLPQVAATASSHFVVTKDVTRDRTFSNLHEVTGKARQEEVARMLGDKSDSALKLAASLLKESEQQAR